MPLGRGTRGEPPALPQVHVVLFDGSEEVFPRQGAVGSGAQQVEAVMGGLRAVGQARQHVHIRNEQRGGEEVARQAHKLVETDLEKHRLKRFMMVQIDTCRDWP